MKVLVYGQQLEIGGSQVNAIELSARLRDVYGHEIIYFATPGPMAKLVGEHRLRYLPAPEGCMHPSPARMKALRAVARRERPDLIHVWDWWQAVDAFYAVHLPMRVPLLVSHMMMDLTRLLPKSVPTTYGTPKLCDQARAEGRRRVSTLLPPVDVRLNAPEAVSAHDFRDRHGILKNDIVLVTVSRLHRQLKSESLLRTMDAIRRLGREFPLRLFIVGEGDLAGSLASRAEMVNSELGRNAVLLTGALLDPRPAYAAADIVVGMGGSALRGMAFAKPVIVVGERGFATPLTPATAEMFHYQGIYGRGTETDADENCVEALRALLHAGAQLPALGAFSRQFVVKHFSLDEVAARLANCYREVTSALPAAGSLVRDSIRTIGISMMEGQVIPFWALRRAYYQCGGVPVLSHFRKALRRMGLIGRQRYPSAEQ